MDMDAITSMIGNNGFPIVMCLILIWYINNTQKALTDAITDLRTTLAEIKTRLDMVGGDKND